MDKYLVAYATWAGATHEVADAIAKVFNQHNTQVDVMKASDVDTISEYKAIILGTSIHAGHTNKDFNQFLKTFTSELYNKPLAVFVVCANMMEDCQENRDETNSWLNKTMKKFPDIKPFSTGLFGGALITEGDDFNHLNFLFKKLILSMKDNILKEHGKTDFRDWSAIQDWAEQIHQDIEAK
jgi:menaquinone-dependent protoporphyrinogen oxidase